MPYHTISNTLQRLLNHPIHVNFQTFSKTVSLAQLCFSPYLHRSQDIQFRLHITLKHHITPHTITTSAKRYTQGIIVGNRQKNIPSHKGRLQMVIPNIQKTRKTLYPTRKATCIRPITNKYKYKYELSTMNAPRFLGGETDTVNM